MLLNLASAINADSPEMLWDFIRRYLPGRHAGKLPVPGEAGGLRDRLLTGISSPRKSSFRQPTRSGARRAVRSWRFSLRQLPENTAAETIQNLVYAVGKRHPFTPLKVLVRLPVPGTARASMEGPRFGGFIALYGIERTVKLIEGALAREEEAA